MGPTLLGALVLLILVTVIVAGNWTEFGVGESVYHRQMDNLGKRQKKKENVSD